LRVAMIGLGSVESVPVYHYHPGGTAVRVWLEQYADDIYSCSDECEICVFSRRGVLEGVETEPEEILDYAVRVGADMTVFEGPYPASEVPESLVELLRKKEITVAFRSMLVGSDLNKLNLADLVVVDIPRDYLIDRSLSIPIVKNLYRLIDADLWIEVNVYLRDPIDGAQKLAPVVEALNGTLFPLHVHVADHKGGGPVRDMYNSLKRKLAHVYVHSDLYSKTDTYCPSCGAHIATREGITLEALSVVKGRCWRCGGIIPFHGRIRERTPKNLLIATGGVRWMHPRLLKGINFSRGPM